jgi:phosphoenolpyruvate carboxykinase (GTP)
MLGRIDGTAGAGSEHIFGVSPNYRDLNWSGLDFSEAQFQSVISIDRDAWVQEMKLHGELFEQLAYHLPVELKATREKILAQLEA